MIFFFFKKNFSTNVWCRRVEKIKRARKIQTTQQDKNCRNYIRTNFRQLPDCPTPVPRPPLRQKTFKFYLPHLDLVHMRVNALN